MSVQTSERTSISKTLMICWLMHDCSPSEVRGCARRIVAIESINSKMLKELSNLSDESIQAVMYNLLEYINR